jgi:hypothetical protein
VDASRPTPPTTQLGESGIRVRAGRLVLLLIAGAVALLCTGGAGVAFVAYRDATEPDRSSPDVAVSNYLRALLLERNDTRADLYACGNDGGLTAIRAFRQDIEARERQYSITIVVSWGALTVQESPGGTTVSTEISRTISDGSEKYLEDWRFDVVDESGWRVCGATRL